MGFCKAPGLSATLCAHIDQSSGGSGARLAAVLKLGRGRRADERALRPMLVQQGVEPFLEDPAVARACRVKGKELAAGLPDRLAGQERPDLLWLPEAWIIRHMVEIDAAIRVYAERDIAAMLLAPAGQDQNLP